MFPRRIPKLGQIQRMIRNRLTRRRNRSWTSYSQMDDEYNFNSRFEISKFNIIVALIKQCLIYIWSCWAPICLVVCVIYFVWFRGAVTNLRYKIGWFSPAQMTISILESYLDENFPKGESPEDGEYISDMGKGAEGLFYEDRVIWKVEGFSQYVHNFTDGQDPIVFGRFQEVLRRNEQIDLTRIFGLWIFSYAAKRSRLLGADAAVGGNEYQTVTAIRALMITDHVVKNLKVPVEDLAVQVSLRVAVIGEATLLVRFEDSLSSKVHKKKIPPERFKGKGFCNLLLNVPFDKRVNSLYIRPVSTNQTADALVLMDNVIIVVAPRRTAESIIHTMAPTEWC